MLLLGPHPWGSSLLPLITWLYGTVGGNAAIPLPLTPEQQDPLREQIKKEEKRRERQGKHMQSLHTGTAGWVEMTEGWTVREAVLR